MQTKWGPFWYKVKRRSFVYLLAALGCLAVLLVVQGGTFTLAVLMLVMLSFMVADSLT